MTDFHIRSTCRLCGDSRLTELLRLPDTPLANEYPKEPALNQDRFELYLVGCEACGHVQLPVVVDPKRLFPPDYPYQSGTSPVFRKHLEDFVADVPCKGYVVEIGCNDGTLLELYKNAGERLGVDPAAPQGDPYYRGYWSKELAQKLVVSGRGGADLVVALNVFAHVDDLDGFAAGVAHMLKPDGMFVFEVGYLPDVIERGLFDVIYHEHMSYHHLTPLVPFFKRHGMELVDAHRVETQGGSVRCFVRNCGGHQAASQRLQALLEEEEGPGVSAVLRRVARLAKHIQRCRERLIQAIKDVKRQGGKVAGYGAPAKLTTLLAACGIFPSQFECVVDDNARKAGSYVPGTALRIEETSYLQDEAPEAVVIFSWNFAKDIMGRRPDAPWKWIIPLPELEIWQYGERLSNPPEWQTLHAEVDRSGSVVVR